MSFITDQIHKKALIYRSKYLPLATSNALAFSTKKRAILTLGLLQTADNARLNEVADIAAASGTVGQQDLALFLRAFVMLSDPDKAKYITAFRRRAALAITGNNYVTANYNVYAWNNPPPGGRRLAN